MGRVGGCSVRLNNFNLFRMWISRSVALPPASAKAVLGEVSLEFFLTTILGIGEPVNPLVAHAYRLALKPHAPCDLFKRPTSLETVFNGGFGCRQTSTNQSLLGQCDCPLFRARPRHSARAAVRVALKCGLLVSERSWLKWIETDARTAPNFRRLRIRWKRSFARSRRRTGRCEFCAR